MAELKEAALRLAKQLDRQSLGVSPCEDGQTLSVVEGTVLRCISETPIYETACTDAPQLDCVLPGVSLVAAREPEEVNGEAMVSIRPKGFVMQKDFRLDLNDFSIFGGVLADDRASFMDMACKNVTAQRAMGSMVGMAVADSIGAVFEMLPILEPGYSFDPATLEVTNEINRFGLRPGQWTDDTSMGHCLADSVLVCEGYNGTDIRVRFWNWWYRGYNNGFRFDTSRCDSIGIGGTIKSSLADIKNDCPPPRYAAPGEDAGNGSLMRLAALPIYFHMDEELALLASSESSLTTHPGAIAADACKFLALILVRALTRSGSTQTISEFLDECVNGFLDLREVGADSPLARLLRSSEPAGGTEMCWNWRDPEGPFLAETLAARGTMYNGFPVSDSYFGSFCLDGLSVALHSIYHTTSFMDAIGKCINFLGDADTMGAICGQIAGAFYGIDSIDDRLRERLRQWDAGETELRGALLAVLGSARSIEQNLQMRRSLEAIRC